MTKELNLPVLVIGAGSIGERHIRVLWSLGYNNIHVLRRESKIFRDIGNASVTVHLSWEDAMKINPYAAFICSPTSLHLEQTLLCIKNGIHLFVEKPLTHNLEGIHQIKKAILDSGVYLQVGYMMRFHPLIVKIKEDILSKKYGDLISIQSKWAEYLPDWHPWEDYRQSYASRKELGGGVTLTLSHDIDMALFLANSAVNSFHLIKNYNSKLEVDVDSGSDILIEFENKIIANIHLNFYEKIKERFLKLVFDDASFNFDFYQSKLTITTVEKVDIIELRTFDRNDLFVAQTKCFFDQIVGLNSNEISLQQIVCSEQIIKICDGK
jgi:predicted dehydrogenase